MNEDDDLAQGGDNEGYFPLWSTDKPAIGSTIALVRDQLRKMSPEQVRAAATVLLALERLPATTPGIDVTFTLSQPNKNGNYGWVDVTITEHDLDFGLGEHFFDPKVGGDTETRMAFEVHAEEFLRKGDIVEWLEAAGVIASEGEAIVEDRSDISLLEWQFEDGEIVWRAEPDE